MLCAIGRYSMDPAASLRIGCLVMAAGNASRFGANKLEAELDGKPLALG